MSTYKPWAIILIVVTAWLVVSTYSYIESMLAINKYCEGVKAGVKLIPAVPTIFCVEIPRAQIHPQTK